MKDDECNFLEVQRYNHEREIKCENCLYFLPSAWNWISLKGECLLGFCKVNKYGSCSRYEKQHRR